MRCKSERTKQTKGPYIWYPAPEYHEQHRQWLELVKWLRENFPQQEAEEWAEFFHYSNDLNSNAVLYKIIKKDAAPMVRLLFQKDPEIFLRSEKHEISNELYYQQILETGILQEDEGSFPFTEKEVHLNATALFALTGAVDCLAALLELGADPDGFEGPQSWNTLSLPCTSIAQPVTPLDCALFAGWEECQMVLEMYGAKTTGEILNGG